jgi:dTDP-4-amino-4,6-dideoxygalactose transaminase
MRDLVQPVTDWVPLADPRADNRSLRSELAAAVASVIEGNNYILGPQVSAFETALATSIGAAGAVGVGTGTDALVLAMLGAGIGAGDEVVAPSHTAGATIAAIRMINAVPVLVDVDAQTFCIDAEAVDAAIGPRVKAIIAVHLYGHPADLPRLNAIADRHNVVLMEDCAQAQGASLDGRPVGTAGQAGCFSFYPTKNLGAIGDGGAVTSDDPEFLARIRAMRTYGWKKAQYAELPNGRCSRLDEVQAAILSVKLASLKTWNERRGRVAAAYGQAFADLPLICPTERPGARHAYHLYVVRSAKRDALEVALRARGIRTGRHYPWPAHAQPALVEGARIPAPLSVTDTLQREILSLPMFGAMTDAQVERTIAAVRDAHRVV